MSKRSLEQRIHASPFLARLAEQGRDFEAYGPETFPSTLNDIIASLRVRQFDDFDAHEQHLIKAKQDFAFAWSIAELQQLGTQEQRGELQTDFAQCSIQFALSLAWQKVALKHRFLEEALHKNNFIIPGLFIFGMGKLGGRDLNFSSDVDLVAYFDPEVLPVPAAVGQSYVCHQALQELTRLLGQGGSSNFIWRVDWRLRPNASATSFAMSTVAACDYYFYHASPWHRLALMKARVIAGDAPVGDKFLRNLSAFIWRQNLDFRALDELAEIKQRINLEHPALRAQRAWPEPIGQDVGGFNVKLGSGGIREIEFFVNAQQLLLGGRRHSLRSSNTVIALRAFADHGLIKPEIATQLVTAYQFLRRVENAVQLYENQQTHLLPDNETYQQAILALLDIDHWSTLVEQLNQVRHFVNGLFQDLFSEQVQAQLGPIVWPKGLNDAADAVVEGWENGFRIYGVSASVRHKLKPLVYALANYLNEGSENKGTDVSDVVLRLHGFFKSLPQGEQYFRLLAESPGLLHSIIPPLLYSPAMTTLLTQSPHIIDCYLHGEWRYPEAFDSDYVLHVDDYGEQLERLRRFVNEHLYQLYQQFLRGQLAVDVFQGALSDLAEHTLELALTIVAQGLGMTSVSITVIGMGKIALRRMSPMSDLDLIFVYDEELISLDAASKFVSRLQTAIASSMREGIVYELDTRLRPSGRSGAPTVSTASFALHHKDRARSWEHIALVPSRIVAGRDEPTLDLIKYEVVNRKRDLNQLRIDARKMWLRIIEHRVTETSLSIMNSKLCVGGLMQAEYLASCLVLAFTSDISQEYQFDDTSPHNIKASVEMDTLLSQCLPHYGLEELPEIIQFWRIQQLWERLLGKTGEPLMSLNERYLTRLLEHSNCANMEDLLAKKKRYSEYVVNGLDRFFHDALKLDIKQIDDWEESSVVWLD